MVPLEVCLLLEPGLGTVFDRISDLTGATHLTLRTGMRTGELVAVIRGTVPDEASTWGLPVAVATEHGFEPIVGTPSLHEIVDTVRFEVPLLGFFQSNTWGADVLVSLVRSAAELEEDDTLLDAYAGVGLFGATVGADAGYVVGLDSEASSIEAARRNLSGAGIRHRYVVGSVASDIEGLEAYWDVAVVDPPRKGLGERGVEAITSAMPRRIVYVSCDPASLARDARHLAATGYGFVDATPVDLFPQTFHVETVATFDRR